MVEGGDMTNATPIDADLLEWLHTQKPHMRSADPWYSCATMTIDPSRAGGACDCGAATDNAMRQRVLAVLYART